MSFLDDLPMATVLALAGVIVTIIAYVSNDISFETAMVSLGAELGGAGVIGHARNGAGRGMRK
jgi:hypothetical protein